MQQPQGPYTTTNNDWINKLPLGNLAYRSDPNAFTQHYFTSTQRQLTDDWQTHAYYAEVLRDPRAPDAIRDLAEREMRRLEDDIRYRQQAANRTADFLRDTRPPFSRIDDAY